MSWTVRRIGLLAVVLGLVAGVVAAVAVPRSTGRPAARPVTVAPTRPQPGGSGRVALRRTGPYAVAARAVDPAGGPPWVLRTFLAERSSTLRGRRHVVGRNRCFQLGRLYGGRFGWIDDRSVFRPVPAGYRGAPIQCGSRLPDLHRQPTVDALHLLHRRPDGRVGAANTVTWAVAGSAARDVDLRLPGGAPRTTAGPWNAAIAVQGPDHETTDGRLAVRYATGPRVDRTSSPDYPVPLGARLPRQPDPDAGTFIAARAADPNGGLPFGLAGARASGGGFCVAQQPGRIVGEHVGGVDFDLGTFVDATIHANDCLGPGAVNRRRPFAGGYGSAMEQGEPAADPVPGRIARRTLPGMQYFAGRVPDDVRSLTLASPRDVRTIAPSSDAHAYLVVYDGRFSAGAMTIVSRYVDGTTTRQRIDLGS